MKGKVFQLIGVYAPTDHGEQMSVFRQINQFVILSKKVVLAGDQNTILNPELDQRGCNVGTNIPSDVKKNNFREFVTRFDLNKFQNEYLTQVVWTWTDKGISGTGQHSNYLNQVLVRSVELDLLHCPSFHSVILLLDSALVCKPQCYDGSEWDKIKALQFVQIH